MTIRKFNDLIIFTTVWKRHGMFVSVYKSYTIINSQHSSYNSMHHRKVYIVRETYFFKYFFKCIITVLFDIIYENTDVYSNHIKKKSAVPVILTALHRFNLILFPFLFWFPLNLLLIFGRNGQNSNFFDPYSSRFNFINNVKYYMHSI